MIQIAPVNYRHYTKKPKLITKVEKVFEIKKIKERSK